MSVLWPDERLAIEVRAVQNPPRLEESRKGQRMTWSRNFDQFADRFSDWLNPLLVKEVRQAHTAGSGGLDRSASQLGDHQTQRPGCLAARLGNTELTRQSEKPGYSPKPGFFS